MDPVAAITTAVTGLGADLQDVAVLALPVAVGLFVLYKGFAIVKRLVK
jgi:hypothetical protein